MMMMIAVCAVQTAAVDSRLTSPVRGTVAALSRLPFVIVSGAGSFLHLSVPSALPVVNIPPATATNQPCDDTRTLQPNAASSGPPSSALSACESSSYGLVQTPVVVAGSSGVLSSGASKAVPRLSRLNAIDLSITAATDPEPVNLPSVTAAAASVIQLPAQAIDLTMDDREASESGAGDVAERTVPLQCRAIRAPVTAAAAASVVQPPPQTVSFTSEPSDGGDVLDRSVPVQRREMIAPIPGAVCSAEDAARVGSSYLCSFCGKTFSSAPQLSVHRNIHYFERRSLRCPVCRASMAGRAALEQHLSREHDVDGGPGTARCRVSTAGAADPRPFKCDECGVAFRIQGHLAKHKRSKVHATRLEHSHDLAASTADVAEDCTVTSAFPLSMDEREAEEVECDEEERQNEDDGQGTDSAAIHEPHQPDSGEMMFICQTCT